MKNSEELFKCQMGVRAIPSSLRGLIDLSRKTKTFLFRRKSWKTFSETSEKNS